MKNPIHAILTAINAQRQEADKGRATLSYFPSRITEDSVRGAIDPNSGHVRYQIFMEGGYEHVPSGLLTLITEELGELAAERFKADYAKFRASLTPQKREELEEKLYPGGRMYGMVA